MTVFTCPLQVSLNGEASSYSQTSLRFLFYPTPLPSGIVPSVAPSSGGVPVTVSGTRYYVGAAPADVRCRSSPP